MFPCIKCTKPMTDDWDEEKEECHGNGMLKPKQVNKSITTQLKAIMLKVTGINKKCKPSSGSASYTKRDHKDSGTTSKEDAPPFPYVEGGSSGSTPTWEITTTNDRVAIGSGSTSTGFHLAFVGIPTLIGSKNYSAAQLTTSDHHVGVIEEGIDLNHEWIAEVEEGIIIIFASLPNEGHDLRRIFFSQEIFNKNLAQIWWYQNYHTIREVYSVVRLNGQAIYTPDDVLGKTYESMLIFEQACSTPKSNPSVNMPSRQLDLVANTVGHNFNIVVGGSSSAKMALPTSLATTPGFSQRNTNMSLEAEWVEQNEHGSFLNIRQSN